jgi:hypothetical protein
MGAGPQASCGRQLSATILVNYHLASDGRRGTLLTVFDFGVTPHLPNAAELPASW